MSKHKKIILLCGPPASGKDTITTLLARKNNIFRHFRKHRVPPRENGKNNPPSYIRVSIDEYLTMIRDNEFVQFHQRYGRFYGVSRKTLEKHLRDGQIPIIHTGKVYDLMELDASFGNNSAKILLWESKENIRERLKLRHPGDPREIQRRLQSYDDEISSLSKINLEKIFDIVIKNQDANKTLRLIETVVAAHADVARARGRSPWMLLEEGKLTALIEQAAPQEPDFSPGSAWRNTYYLSALWSLAEDLDVN